MNKYIAKFFVLICSFVGLESAVAQDFQLDNQNQQLNVSPEIIENSPTWQKWIDHNPNLLDEIKNKPSFPTRVRFGYSQFPSNNGIGGVSFALEDLFIGDTPLTFSARYSTSFITTDSDNNPLDRTSFSTDLNYYLLPLGNYINVAPVVGYRSITTNGYSTDGLNVGLRLALALSPQGASDVFVTQSFLNVGSSDEVGVTDITAAYAVNKNLRLSTQIQWQNSIQQSDSQVSIGLEWMLK